MFASPPPPPAGFSVDPLASIKASGANITSGYRDPSRNKRVGGVAGSDHLDASAMDLTPGKGQSWDDLRGLAEAVAASHGNGARVIDESRTGKPHIHLSLPGWGGAPGLPPPPAGFEPVTLPGAVAGVPSPYETPMAPMDAKAAAPDVPESFLEASRLKAIMHPHNFAPAPASLFTEPPMTEERELAALNRITHPQAAPPPADPRIGIAPLINNVTARITGEQMPQVVDTSGTVGGFFDEMPVEVRRKLTAEQIEQYVALARRGGSAPEIKQLFGSFGYDIHNAEDIAKAIAKGGAVNKGVVYKLPEVTNPDGAGGAAVRGLVDPINLLDEAGAVADTLTGYGGRPSIWNSDAGISSIFSANVDANRAILAADEREHPYARLGGQLASGIVMPYGAGARTAGQFAKVGAVEGGLAGFGAGEGNPLERLPNTAVGSALGATAGAALGAAVNAGSRAAGAVRNRLGRGPSGLGDTFRDAAMESVPVVDDGLQAVGPTPASRYQPQGGVMAARMDDEAPEISERVRDYINIPPPPPGFTPVPGTMRAVEDVSRLMDVEEAAKEIGPEDVLPLAQAAPDERAGLGSRSFDKGSSTVYQRGPVDLVGFARSMGGLQDEGGELSHLGINNAARDMDFAQGEGFLGGLVRDDGRSLDEMAEAAWEAGYFRERPTVPEFLDALADTHSGHNRRWLDSDLGEVAEHEAARSQRYAMEAAEQDAPEVLKVANVRLDKIETPKDISRALEAINAATGNNPSLARVSHEETAKLADQLGMKPEHLLQRRQGSALNATEAYAARNLHAAAVEDTMGRARKALGGSDEDKAAFLRSITHTAAITDQISGAAAEAGRALSQYRMVAKANKASAAAIKALIEGKGGHKSIDDMAQALIDLERDPAAMNRFIQKAAKSSWKDKAVELYYNSLLSGPQTHAVNIVSNALTSVLQIPEHATAAAIGQLRRSSVDRVMASELGPRVVGLMQGAMEGLKAARYTFKTGRVPDHVTKVEAAVQEAIPGKVGHVLRVPTRALSAEDEFFKAIARRSELAALAVRKAKGEGHSGDKLAERIEYLTGNPTAEMLEQAKDYARYVTFQRPVGPVAGAVLHATQAQPWLKLFLPFVRTPTNILKFATERSPFAPMLKEVRDDFRAGGARRDLAVARMTLGSGLGLYVAELARQGMITGGGPADENARRVMQADGWQPYSLKVGNRYYSYQRLDPLATTLGVAADYVELQSAMTDRQREKVASLVTASIISNLSDKTWLSGLSDAVAAIHDPQRNLGSLVNRTVGSVVVPTGVAQIARTLDPVAREVKTPLEAIQSRIPGLSDNLRPRLDAWGQPVVKEGGVGPDIASPFYTSTRRGEPENEEALRLGLKVTDPSRIVAGNRLDDEQWHAYRSQAGTYMKDGLARAMMGPEWQAMTDGEKRKAFDGIKKEARKRAREELGLAHGEDGKEQALPPPPPGFSLAE